MAKRKLVDITLDEAIHVLKLGEGHQSGLSYKLRVKNSSHNQDKKFAQLYYISQRIGENKESEGISVNFSDDENAVVLCQGNKYYRTHYKIIKYLESKGFDLESANKNH